jgi:hypothetical protein
LYVAVVLVVGAAVAPVTVATGAHQKQSGF